MGTAVLTAHPEVAEIRSRADTHFAADLAPFGLDNPGAVYTRRTGRTASSSTVIREDAPDPGLAWSAGLT